MAKIKRNKYKLIMIHKKGTQELSNKVFEENISQSQDLSSCAKKMKKVPHIDMDIFSPFSLRLQKTFDQ